MIQPLSDVTLIYLVIVVLYLAESVPWIRPGCAGIGSFFGSFRNPTRNHKLIGNDAGFLSTFGPAPFDATFIVESCPISISEAGVVGFQAASAIAGDRPFCSEQIFTWSELSGIKTNERDLWVGNRLVGRLSSPLLAKQLADAILHISRSTDSDRKLKIHALTDSLFDTKEIRIRLHQWRDATKPLKRSSTVLAIWIFMVGGLLYQGWIPGFNGAETLWGYLVVLILLWWMNNAILFLAHRRLYPGLKGQRWKMLLTSMVSPAAAMRGTDHLARHLLDLRHPLAIAAALMPKAELPELAASVIRDLRFPKLPDQPTEPIDLAEPTELRETRGVEIANQFRECLIEAALRFCDSQSIPRSALEPPTKFEEGTISYCPRCLQEFSLEDAQCTPCGNRPAQSLRHNVALGLMAL